MLPRTIFDEMHLLYEQKLNYAGFDDSINYAINIGITDHVTLGFCSAFLALSPWQERVNMKIINQLKQSGAFELIKQLTHEAEKFVKIEHLVISEDGVFFQRSLNDQAKIYPFDGNSKTLCSISLDWVFFNRLASLLKENQHRKNDRADDIENISSLLSNIKLPKALKTRVENCLKLENVFFSKQLLSLNDTDIEGIPNLGTQGELAIYKAISFYLKTKNQSFGVIAGKYESGFDCDENIKYADDGLTFAEAVEKAKDMSNYPFCYITYKDHRLSLN